MKREDAPPSSARRTGRPLSFDRDQALARAMLVFWRHGYETTSIVDLTTAMGVSAPSLYTAFGDKKRLFLEAMRLYAGDLDALGRAIEIAPTSRDAARELLVGSAERFTGEATPRGCLLASATATGSSAAADVQRAVADVRARIGDHLRARIMRDIAGGVLPETTDADALCGLIVATIQGLSVLARDGGDRSRLMAIAEAALSSWPARPRRQRTARGRREAARLERT